QVTNLGGIGEEDAWWYRRSLVRYEYYRCPARDTSDSAQSSSADFPRNALHPFYFYFHSGARDDIEALFCPHVNHGGQCCWAVDVAGTCLPDPFDSTGANLTAVLARA